MKSRILLWCLIFLALGSSAHGAPAPDLSVRQNHMLFQFAHEDGRVVCAVQEIVVVESGGDVGTVRLSVPNHAERVSPLPVPDVMPGGESHVPLRNDEVVISPGEILIKRPLRPGKNTFSYGYVIFAENDAVRLEKKILLNTRLMAAFAPPVGKLTSRTLQVERAEEGYKILGHDLQAGTNIDLHFEGVHAVLSGPEEPSRSNVSTQNESQSSTWALNRYAAPSVAGILLAVLVVLYLGHVKKSRAAAGQFRQYLMDEMESLDAAAEKKEISAEYHKRKKKALMDRLRSW